MANSTFQRPLAKGALLSVLALLAACSGDSILPSSTTEKPIIAQEPVSTGAPEIKRISASGGTKIAVLVNDQAITNNDIRRRANFVKLRRMKGNPSTVARQELIDEAIKMQEARRLNAVVSDKEVDAAYVRFAQRNKMPVKALGQVLDQRGVTRKGFKKFIRAQMSWQRVVGARIRAGGTSATATPGVSPVRQTWLADVGQETRDVKEYTLQQVVFTVTKKERSSQLAGRTAAAKNFRNRLNGCTGTRELAKGLKNVAVLDRGRVRETSLPPQWRKAVAATPAGKATRVIQTPKGAEMLIVCRSRTVQAAATGLAGFDGDNGQKAVSEVEKKYLAELKERAVIKNR